MLSALLLLHVVLWYLICIDSLHILNWFSRIEKYISELFLLCVAAAAQWDSLCNYLPSKCHSLHTFSLLITSLIVTSSNEALIHSSPPASEGLTADAPPPRRQDQIRTSGVGVQQGGRLMIREGLKGGRGSEWAGSLQEQSGTRRRRWNDAHTAVWELKRLQERGQEVSGARML